MSDLDDRKLDAEFDRYMDNRDPEDVYNDMLDDLEHDIEEAIGKAIGKHPDLSDGDVIKVLEDYIGFIKKRRQQINEFNNKKRNENGIKN